MSRNLGQARRIVGPQRASPGRRLNRRMSSSQSSQGAMNQLSRPQAIPFIDLVAQRRRIGKPIDDAVARVMSHCQFINGPEVTQLESALAAFSGARHVVTCASGTDALLMVLMAKGVGRCGGRLCSTFPLSAAGRGGALARGTPGVGDVDETTFNMDAASLKRGI